MKEHEDKVAVITGGNTGIGYGIADELIAQGAKATGFVAKAARADRIMSFCFFSNNTGARADEAAQVKISDLNIGRSLKGALATHRGDRKNMEQELA